MGPEQVIPDLVRVDMGVIVMKSSSHYLDLQKCRLSTRCSLV